MGRQTEWPKSGAGAGQPQSRLVRRVAVPQPERQQRRAERLQWETQHCAIICANVVFLVLLIIRPSTMYRDNKYALNPNNPILMYKTIGTQHSTHLLFLTSQKSRRLSG